MFAFLIFLFMTPEIDGLVHQTRNHALLSTCSSSSTFPPYQGHVYTTALFAKKSSKKKRGGRNTPGQRTASASGFGGAAVEDCPCGSGLGYMKCCGKIHKDPEAYAKATAEQVVRARYSAYAKREVDFIVGSTHPLNKDFMTDIEHWKETIRTNCYDNFELKSCKILSESYEGEGDKEIGKVKFVATMTQVDSREKTAFMETSKFERAGKHIRGGAWLYKSGEIESPDEREEEVMGDEKQEDQLTTENARD